MPSATTLNQPAVITPPIHRRLTGALAAGTAIANAVAISEVIPLGQVRYLTIRAATATAGGTLAFDFVAPEATNSQFRLAAGELDPAKLTAYGDSLKPASQTITAGTTPAVIQVTCNGESYGVVTVTGGGTGTLTYVDIAAI